MLMKKFTACTKKDPFPTDEEMGKIKKYVSDILSAHPEFTGTCETAFLIGGTARAAAKLHSDLLSDGAITDGYTFTSEDLKKVCDHAFSDIREGGKWIRETVSDRVISIIPGLVAYLVIAEMLGLSRFVMSSAGVREGFLIEYITKNFLQKSQES
jgi:exopolyphosphatase/pppGpp-phosphohydrolase